MKVNQITEKQQKIVRPVRWSRGEYEKPNVKQSNNKGNRGENRENEVTKTRVTTAEKEEITTEIRKNKKIRFKLEFAVF